MHFASTLDNIDCVHSHYLPILLFVCLKGNRDVGVSGNFRGQFSFQRLLSCKFGSLVLLYISKIQRQSRITRNHVILIPPFSFYIFETQNFAHYPL